MPELRAAELRSPAAACLPFDSHFLDVDGRQYHYVDEGQGRPVVCVHGNPTWCYAWRHVVRGLSPDHRMLAVDHIGCGLSDKPQDYAYRLEQHVANLCAWIEQLDLHDITLVGHDWGGAIGVGAVQRLRSRFRGMVLLNTAAFRSTRIPWRIAACRIPGLGPLAVRGLNLFCRAALWMATTDRGRWTRAMRKAYVAPYDNWAHRVAVMRFVQDIPLHPRHPSYATLQQIEDGLSGLADLPIRLIWGMRDWCFSPQFLREFQKRWPHADVCELDSAGHYVFEDAADEVVSLIGEFLRAEVVSGASADEGRV